MCQNRKITPGKIKYDFFFYFYRWFLHMYLFAAPFSMCILYLAICRYFYNMNVPENIYSTLDFLLGNDRQSLVSPASAILALTLVTVQSTKRLYETLFVNVFSDAKMNITHYFAGFIHYAGLNLAILGESEGFVGDSEVNFENSLSLLDCLAALIFLLMSYQQLKSNFILANLRKNEKGVVVTKEHKIPTGGYFEYISNPLQFTEIVMYAMLQIVLRNSSTYSYIYMWVLVNQFVTGLLSHQWYKKNFKDYPPSRKIIVPYLL
ncbi:polyprenol reductase [Belonocnema kinseyi]|uniref:polyprenol reductase n=1 Tax=Belonocnema kinseyi TaxID=2817044 RepID=UPI00143E05AD|nr:polyprenol reductase [Belonocnema kinseyi]